MRYGLLMKVCGVVGVAMLSAAAMGMETSGVDCSGLKQLGGGEGCKSINKRTDLNDKQKKSLCIGAYGRSQGGNGSCANNGETCSAPCMWDAGRYGNTKKEQYGGMGRCKVKGNTKCINNTGS